MTTHPYVLSCKRIRSAGVSTCVCAWPDMWLSFPSLPCSCLSVLSRTCSLTLPATSSLDFLCSDSSVSLFLWDHKLLHAYRPPILRSTSQSLPILRISASRRRHIWSSLPALRKLHLSAFLPPMPPASQSSCLEPWAQLCL